MKVIVKEEFLDRSEMIYRGSGETFECSTDRAKQLADLDLVEMPVVPKEETPTVKETPRETPKQPARKVQRKRK